MEALMSTSGLGLTAQLLQLHNSDPTRLPRAVDGVTCSGPGGPPALTTSMTLKRSEIGRTGRLPDGGRQLPSRLLLHLGLDSLNSSASPNESHLYSVTGARFPW